MVVAGENYGGVFRIRIAISRPLFIIANEDIIAISYSQNFF